MTALDKFVKGDRVVLSPEGEEQFRYQPQRPRTGTVTGFGRQSYLVRIRLDGKKDNVSFHERFWDVQR